MKPIITRGLRNPLRRGLWLIAFLPLSCSHAPKKAPQSPAPIVFATPDYDKSLEAGMRSLEDQGIPPALIAKIRKKFIYGKPDWNESVLRVLEPNLFGFIYHGNYLAHDSAVARKSTARFLRSHKLSFDAAEKAYGVSREAIAALLWVETKFRRHGSFPLPWVFFSLSLASQPDFCNAMRARLPSKLEASLLPERPRLEAADEKLKERCKSKSEWAIEELKALSSLDESGHIAPFRIKGSFAGAFGLPQFIPSSYQKYAVSEYRRKPDLFMISDAILSVGRFLSENGWEKDSEESQLAALYSYNRSRDYGMVIRKIAAGLQAGEPPGKI